MLAALVSSGASCSAGCDSGKAAATARATVWSVGACATCGGVETDMGSGKLVSSRDQRRARDEHDAALILLLTPAALHHEMDPRQRMNRRPQPVGCAVTRPRRCEPSALGHEVR